MLWSYRRRTLLLTAVVCGFASWLHAAPTIVCIGDSITQEVHLPAAQSYPSQLGLMLPNATVFNSGISGNTSSQGWARWTTDVASHNPNYVAIMFGTNDSVMTNYNTYQVPVSQFTTNLTNMASWCNTHNATPIICSLPPIIADMYFDRHPKAYYDAVGGLNSVLQTYYNAAKSVAQTTVASFIPVMDLFSKDMSLIRHDDRDGVHYTADGDYVQARAVDMTIASLSGRQAGDLYLVTQPGHATPDLWSAAGGTPHLITTSTQIANSSARVGVFNNNLFLASHDNSFGGIWKYDGTSVSGLTSTGDLSGSPVAFTVYQDDRYRVTASVTNTAWTWNVIYAVPEPGTGLMTLLGLGVSALAGWIRKRLTGSVS